MGATKNGEYQRTAEIVDNIAKYQGLFFALAFLYDSQYTREDVGEILTIMSENKIGFKRG